MASPLRDALLGRVARPNLGTRQTLVADAFDLVAQSPWFGLGAPQTALFSNDTNDVSVGTHGQFFTLLVSHGYPGVIFYYGFFLAMLVVTWKAGHRAWWAWAAIVVLIGQAAFYNGVPIPLILGCLAVVLCLRELPRAGTAGSGSPGDRLTGGLRMVPDAQAAPDVQETGAVRQYGRALRGKVWLVAAFGVAGAVLGSQLLPAATYLSTSAIEVQDGYVDLANPGNTDRTNMVTEQQVAVSSGVIAGVVEALGGEVNESDLDQRGLVTSPADSTTLVFSYTAPTADEARDVVTAWSAAYLEQRVTALEAALEAERDEAEQRLDGIEEDLALARETLSAIRPGTRGAEAAAIRVANLTSQLDSARRTYSQLQVLSVDAGRSLGAASDPGGGSGLSTALAALLGGLAGLMLGTAVALLLTRMDRRTTGQQAIAGVDVWAEIGDTGFHTDELRAVAARLGIAHQHHDVGTVMVASLTGTEPDVHEALAESLSEMGVTVRQLDGTKDLFRDPVTTPANAKGSGNRPRPPRVLSLVSAPPALRDASTAVLGSQVDQVVLSVDGTMTDRRHVEETVRTITRAGGRVAGILVWGKKTPLWRRSRRRRAWRRAER